MLGIRVSEGTAEGWFGQGKISAILSIIVLVALIVGIAFAIYVVTNGGRGTNVSQPIVPAATTPTPTPPTPAPQQTPTPIQTPVQTSTLTQDSKKIILQQYGNPPANLVGTQEIIAKALAGQYQKGASVGGVSAIYEGKGTYGDGDREGIFAYFGPAYQGFYIGIWLHEDILGLGALQEGDTAVFDGEYYAVASKKLINESWNVIFLDNTRLFLIKR